MQKVHKIISSIISVVIQEIYIEISHQVAKFIFIFQSVKQDIHRLIKRKQIGAWRAIQYTNNYVIFLVEVFLIYLNDETLTKFVYFTQVRPQLKMNIFFNENANPTTWSGSSVQLCKFIPR